MFSCALSGCILGSERVNWSSPGTATDQTAILKGDPLVGIRSLDDNKDRHCSNRVFGVPNTYRTCDVVIDSGPHKLVVIYSVANQYTDDILIDFVAQPGGIYQVKCDIEKKNIFVRFARCHVSPV